MIDDHIKRLEADIKKAQAELAKIARLREEFPDLEIEVSRGGTVRYLAESANARVFQVELHNTCGCCPEAGVVARPFLEFGGSRIYSNPSNLLVGHRTWDDFIVARDGWRKQYETAGISHHAVAKIKKILEESRPRYDEEGDDVDVA